MKTHKINEIPSSKTNKCPLKNQCLVQMYSLLTVRPFRRGKTRSFSGQYNLGCQLEAPSQQAKPTTFRFSLRFPRKSKDQTLPLGSRESFTWIILKTILCLVLDFQGFCKRQSWQRIHEDKHESKIAGKKPCEKTGLHFGG